MSTKRAWIWTVAVLAAACSLTLCSCKKKQTEDTGKNYIGVAYYNQSDTFLNELLDRPASTVACEHRKVMDMHIARAVSVRNLLIVDLAEPVVGCDGTAVGEDETAD